MPSLQSVYLAGLGHCSARGLSPAAAASAMLAGQTAHDWRQIGDEPYPYFRMSLQGTWLQRVEVAVRACVADLRAAVPAAQWRDLPVFFASSSFQVGLYESPDRNQLAAANTAPVPEASAPSLPLGAASFALQCMQWLGMQGMPQCVSHACTSSMLALEAAANWLAHGWSQHALVIATECDNRLTANGFHSLGLLSHDACRPLAANRSGFVLGEAVAAVLLSTDPGLGQGLSRNEGEPWRLTAWASATDSYSLTGPDPSGEPIAAVLQAALRQAGLRAADIDLVKLHAAGVGSTDAAEARALQQVFGTRMPLLLSLKPYLGHTLGASTLVEITALLACLQQGQIPATPGCEQPDAELDLLPVRVHQPLQPKHVLAISLGFGGSVTACILSRGGGMSFFITAHVRTHLVQADLAQAVAQHTGQPLRRASPLASLALLACLDVLAQEAANSQQSATGPTALIWHSQQGPQPETEALLAAQQTGDGLLLPFDFLASQPALLCVQLKPWLPDLAQTLFLPGTAHPHEQAWMQMLQFAHFALEQKRFGRVICASLERDSDICRYAAISLVTDSLTGVSRSEQAGPVHGWMNAPNRAMNRPLLRGCWLPLQSKASDATAELAATRVPASQTDVALWHWLEGGCAAADAGQTVVLSAQGACLHLQRLLG